MKPSMCVVTHARHFVLRDASNSTLTSAKPKANSAPTNGAISFSGVSLMPSKDVTMALLCVAMAGDINDKASRQEVVAKYFMVVDGTKGVVVIVLDLFL
jgi:hypothetical protein